MKLYNISKTAYHEFIYGAHLTALASTSIVCTFFILFNIEINVIALLIAYLTTFIIYSHDYQKDSSIDSEIDVEKIIYIKNRKKLYPYIIGSYIILNLFLLLLSFYIYKNYNFTIFIIIILTGGILYTFGLKKLTKYFPGFKSIYTTALWAYAGSFFIIYYNGLDFNFIYLIMFLFIFLKLLINAIFFDIKDVNIDKKHNLKTIPILLGNNKTIILLSILNVVALIILTYTVYMGLIPSYGIILGIFFFYTEYYIFKARHKNQKNILKYTYILPDSEFILWPIFLFISKIFII